MKKKSASHSPPSFISVPQSACFWSCPASFWRCMGFGRVLRASAAKNNAATKSINLQLLPPGFDCARLTRWASTSKRTYGLELIMIACGESEGGSAYRLRRIFPVCPRTVGAPAWRHRCRCRSRAPRPFPTLPSRRRTPWLTRITPTRSSSPTTIPEPPRQNYSGAISLHATAARPSRASPQPLRSGHGTNFGDPVTLYNTAYRHFLCSLSRYGLRRTGHRRLEVH